MKQSIKKYLSGSLKNRVGNKLPTLRLFIILFLANVAYAQDIAKTENYLPNGKYRLFGSGRGEVHNIDNQIRLHGQLSQQAGNLHIQTSLYQGNLSYQQHFHNHGHRQHAPFENKAQRNFSAKKGSIVQGGATLTDLSVTGYEIHPADAYDGEQGGGYPLPTGARDEYLYEVNGKEVSVKVVALDKLPNKINDNQLLREAGIDPAKYEQPQTTDNRTQIERISFANNQNNINELSDLSQSTNSWENAQIRQPESLLHNPKFSAPMTSVAPIVYEIPSSSTRLTDEYGFRITIPRYKMTLGTPNANNKNGVMTSVVRKVIVTPSPYTYFKSHPYDSPLLGNNHSSGSSSQSNSGSNNKQNNHQGNDDNPIIFGYYDDGDDYAHSDDEDYGYNYGYDNDDYYGGNHQNQQQPDTAENKSSFEDDILALRLSPPPPFTEYDDGTKNNTNTANNYPTQNNDDWQAEKWDSPVDWNMAEIAIGIGSVANDLLNIANKGRLGDLSPDVLKRNAALGDLNSINNLEAASEITATQANALRKAAAGKPITLNNGYYSVDGMKISQQYYEKLWSNGRPAPFIQAQEVLNSNPKVSPDRMTGFNRYEGAGLEMIYNPKTGEIWHIQPMK